MFQETHYRDFILNLMMSEADRKIAKIDGHSLVFWNYFGIWARI